MVLCALEKEAEALAEFATEEEAAKPLSEIDDEQIVKEQWKVGARLIKNSRTLSQPECALPSW